MTAPAHPAADPATRRGGPPLIPRPSQLTTLPGRFTLDAHTAVRAAPGGATAAADLLRTLLAPATGLPLPAAADGSVVLVVDPALAGLGREGYGLTVGADAVLLRAAHPDGLLNAVQTIRQLLPPEALSAEPVRGTEWTLPCVQITDVPRFAWRGVMLDVARRFRPVSFLRRFVDLLALHKLNVLHLHLTDDQGWRMPVAAYPRLTTVGGEPHGGAYTRRELEDLIAYAAARGISVVPEIEMPGHVRAALAAYPELGNDPSRRLRRCGTAGGSATRSSGCTTRSWTSAVPCWTRWSTSFPRRTCTSAARSARSSSGSGPTRPGAGRRGKG